jgi:multiple sugar transport system substrate-binding protein
VSKYSNNKQQAIEFIRFLQTEESQKTMFEIGGYLPISRRVYDDTAYMNGHPNLAYYKQLMANGFHRPALTDYTRISDIISHYVHRAIKGELTADVALEMAMQKIRVSNASEE